VSTAQGKAERKELAPAGRTREQELQRREWLLLLPTDEAADVQSPKR
jgi:hypothetical protein